MGYVLTLPDYNLLIQQSCHSLLKIPLFKYPYHVIPAPHLQLSHVVFLPACWLCVCVCVRALICVCVCVCVCVNGHWNEWLYYQGVVLLGGIRNFGWQSSHTHRELNLTKTQSAATILGFLILRLHICTHTHVSSHSSRHSLSNIPLFNYPYIVIPTPLLQLLCVVVFLSAFNCEFVCVCVNGHWNKQLYVSGCSLTMRYLKFVAADCVSLSNSALSVCDLTAEIYLKV